MKKIITTSLLILAAIALLGLSSAAFAEDRVVNVKVRADSEHPGSEAFRAMDGNAGSIWHSGWKAPAAVTDLPHEIVVDLGASYEITGFTCLPRVHAAAKSAIKDYEAYLSDRPQDSMPLSEGKPVAKGTFAKKQGENVVKFAAPVKGRFFRLRALSEVTGSNTWAAIAELTLHCEGVKFVGKPWSLRVDFPKAGEDVIRLIEGFPLLNNLLLLEDPWKWDAIELKDRIFTIFTRHSYRPRPLELAWGSKEHPILFVDKRFAADYREVNWKDYWRHKEKISWPGLKVWDFHTCVADYYVVNPARPFIRLHLGCPPVCYADFPILFPGLPDSARKDIIDRLEKAVAGLAPYGAKRLPLRHPNVRKYLLPRGTIMTFRDMTGTGSVVNKKGQRVKMWIDFEPAKRMIERTPLPAFPGAEGYGAYARGGRGGKVYIVTTLKDYLPRERPAFGKCPAIPKQDPIPGSLRAAVEAKGPRIIMFGVSGTIELVAPLEITNPYVTLVGHTAPGEGVQIRNWYLTTNHYRDRGANAHDVVLRYLRVRVGEIKGPGKMRRVHREETQGLDFTGINIIVDHCEFAYGNDQIVNIRAYRPCFGGPYSTIRQLSSFQWNYVYGGQTGSTHGKGNHSMGYIMGGPGFNSFHHNLTAHVTRRNPRAGGTIDWRNNVLYHYQGSGYGGEPNDIMMNYVGNTQKRGGWGYAFLAKTGNIAYFYARDNIGVANPPFQARRETIADQPWTAEPVKTDPAKVAYQKVLKYGGVDLPVRDVITTFISESTRTNTGNFCGTPADWPHGGYATYKPAKLAPDADKDGMPDWWEKKYGLDPKNALDNAADKDKDGYTNVEEYINDTDPTKFVDYRKPENNVHSLHRADTIHRRTE